MRQLILDLRPDTPPDFNNFLPGPNAEVMAALRAHVPDEIRSEPLLYLWGEAGVGKSHLLRAWARNVAANVHSNANLPQPPVAALAVDDVESLDADAQIRLFNLINSARELGGLLLIGASLPPKQLDLRADLTTRLAQGLVLRLQPLSDEDKLAAMTVRAEGRGLRLPHEVARYLLTHSRRDLPGLLATVDALDTFSLSRKRPVSLPLLKELLLEHP